MADVLSFAKVLAKVRMTSVSGVRTARCVAELLLNAKGELRGMVARQNVAASTVQQLGEDFSVVRSIHRITRQGGTKTRFEPGRSCRIVKHSSDVRQFIWVRRPHGKRHAAPSPVFITASLAGFVSTLSASSSGLSK